MPPPTLNSEEPVFRVSSPRKFLSNSLTVVKIGYYVPGFRR